MHETVGRSGMKALMERLCPAETPGYAWSVLLGGDRRVRGWGGSAAVTPRRVPVRENTLFDLASLTKPLSTAFVALSAGDRGDLDLSAPLPLAGDPPLTPLHLLRHEAGFPPWLPLYGELKDPGETLPWLLERCPRHKPGREVAYSCLGYIALGLWMEETLGKELRELFRERVADPLGIPEEEACFLPGDSLRERCAATEVSPGHEVKMARRYGTIPPPFRFPGGRGEVNDGNARFLGGAAGNAGLFATLGAVETLCGAYCDGGLVSDDSLSLAWRSPHPAGGPRYTAGWKACNSAGWQAASHLPPGSIGHEGFTGTGAWLEPGGERRYILLTNRIHPVHPERDFGPSRAAFLLAAGAYE